VAAERASPIPLMFLAVATATAFLFPAVRLQLLRLVRRTRWLLLVLLLTYAYAVPGTPVWIGLGWASPAFEGLQQGGMRVARLVLLLAALAALLATTSRPRLIYGLYVLALPLTWLGFDRRAFAVRLGLTLDYVEHAPKPARWLDALRSPIPEVPGPATYVLEAERWHVVDSLVILAGLALVWALVA
jgi:hypothetical protein